MGLASPTAGWVDAIRTFDAAAPVSNAALQTDCTAWSRVREKSLYGVVAVIAHGGPLVSILEGRARGILQTNGGATHLSVTTSQAKNTQFSTAVYSIGDYS